MNLILFHGRSFSVFLIWLKVFCLEAAIVELPQEKYELELNKIKENEKFLITSSVGPAAITTTTTTITTITLTKISGNESSMENIIVQSSFEPSVSLFKNEETSILDSHLQFNEPNSSQTTSLFNNILAKLEESELVTPTFKEYKPANSKENLRSLPITAVSAIPFTSIYQPVIHLEKENEIELQFFKYLSILESPFLKRLANKVLKYKDPIEELKSKTVILNEYLSNKQLRSIFKLSKHAIPSLLRCQQPESTITIKCISNAARITFVSDSETRFNAKASINRKRSTEILLDGYKLNAYLVWWTEQNKTKSELGYKLTKENLQRKCEGCKQLETMIKLESENHASLIPVLCRHPQNEVITFDPSKLSAKYNVRNIPVITTSMALHELENKEGNLIIEELTSGTDVYILIQATSDVIPVGIFVRECKITSNKMHGIKILNNGCSISHLLENFKVVVSPSDKNYKFAAMAKFTSFSVETSSQNLTLGCSIMVCDGMCDVHSSCQKNIKQHPFSTNSRTIQEIYLETTYKILPEKKITIKILPENSVKAGQHLKDIPVANVPYDGVTIACLEADSNQVSRGVCYVYLVLVCLMFIVLLSTIVIYFKRHKVMNKSNYEEEIESPQRTFYHYDSNTRRRSPNSSSILNLGD